MLQLSHWNRKEASIQQIRDCLAAEITEQREARLQQMRNLCQNATAKGGKTTANEGSAYILLRLQNKEMPDYSKINEGWACYCDCRTKGGQTTANMRSSCC